MTASETILITDGEQRAALAVVRSLGAAGYRVIVGAGRTPSLAGSSRWAAAQVALPDPLTDPAGYAGAVEEAVTRHAATLVLPMAEPALLALVDHRERISATIPWPPASQVRAICDKAGVLATAARIGIATPPQQTVLSRGELPDLEGLTYPLVLKPARSVGEADGVRAKLGVRHVASPRELLHAVESLPAAGWPILLQELIVGPGLGVFLLRWNGETRAAFAHRRIREKPPSGGVSVCCEAAPLEAGLLDLSVRLLDAYEWQGVAMVEYKLDQARGTPVLMEVNPRFWGSLQLAVDAGVDFPRLLVDAAFGRAPEPAPAWRTGIRNRWWWGDVDHLLARWRHAASTLALPPGAPSRMTTTLEVLWPWRPGQRGEVWRWSDPRPAWQETKDWLRGR